MKPRTVRLGPAAAAATPSEHLTDALLAALHERLFGGEIPGPPRLADLR